MAGTNPSDDSGEVVRALMVALMYCFRNQPLMADAAHGRTESISGPSFDRRKWVDKLSRGTGNVFEGIFRLTHS
jgi:hypothetical protein